jgi:hypothetical protein
MNICADILSRAISENLNCALQRDHPISKKWAKHLPPIRDNFSVDNETLFKFLTTPLKPEREDMYDRKQRRLVETRSVQTWFDLTSTASCEKRFNDALKTLQNWNKEWSWKHKLVKEIKGNLDMERQRACLSKIQEVMDNMYGDITNTSLYKKVKASLVEATKDWLKVKKGKLSINYIKESHQSVEKVVRDYLEFREKDEAKKKELDVVQANLNKELMHSPNLEGEISGNCIKIVYMLSKGSYIHPTINELQNLEIPLQKGLTLKPNEIVKVDLGIKFGVPKGYKISVVKALEGPSCDYELVELANDKHGDFFRISIQNTSICDIVRVCSIKE